MLEEEGEANLDCVGERGNKQDMLQANAEARCAAPTQQRRNI